MSGREGEGETRRDSPTLPLSRSPITQWIALFGILIVAAGFRLYGLAWDSGYLFHPDERKIVLVASELRLPSSVSEFFSSESPLNPKFFAYGSFPIYLLKALSVFVPSLAMNAPWREDLVTLALLGRALSALFDLGTIALTFLLARRLYDSMTGLIASACLAVTVLHIQLSHFYAVDTLLVFFIVATIYFAARFSETNGRRDALGIGVCFGFALATKITAAPLIVPIVIAVGRAKRDRETRRQGDGEKEPRASLSPPLLVRHWSNLIWQARFPITKILLVALTVFIIAQPYALLDPIRYFGQIGTELLVARGWLDFPYTRQYADTLPFVYPIAQSSIWGMSLPLGVLAWVGGAIFVWRWWRNRALSGVEGWKDGFILSWVLLYFVLTGGQYAKYLRYLLPLTPFLFIMVSSLKFQVSGFKSRVLRVVFGASLFCAFVYSLAFVSMYAREHPWLEISRWIYANIPAGSTLAVEHWDDALPVPMRNDSAERTPSEYRTLTLPMYDLDDAAKLDVLVNGLSQSDYIVLATQRLSSTITRLPQRYPMSSRYYKLLFGGELGFDLAAYALNGIALDGIVVVDDRFDSAGLTSDAVVWDWGHADESFTVYDHPLPLVFRKTRTTSPEALRVLLVQP